MHAVLHGVAWPFVHASSHVDGLVGVALVAPAQYVYIVRHHMYTAVHASLLDTVSGCMLLPCMQYHTDM